jgi:hypothetical protein
MRPCLVEQGHYGERGSEIAATQRNGLRQMESLKRCVQFNPATKQRGLHFTVGENVCCPSSGRNTSSPDAKEPYV